MKKQFIKIEEKPKNIKESNRLKEQAKKRAKHSYPHLHKIG